MSRTIKDLISEFKEVVGSEGVLYDSSAKAAYESDASELRSKPHVVLLPSGTSQVSGILKIASRERIPVVPRGAGSGMSGGAVGKGGIILSMERMNKILEINVKDSYAIAEAGVVTADLDRAAARYGLFYPPDPSSVKFCTVGGNVATTAGGPRTVKYGTTRKYVLGMEICTADGSVIKLGAPVHKRSCGPDLSSLITGSEGTLAVITSVVLRLIKRPLFKNTLAVGLDNEREAFELIDELLNIPQALSCCEYIDKNTTICIEDSVKKYFNPTPSSLLLLEVDALNSHELDTRLDSVVSTILKRPSARLVMPSTGDGEELWEMRRSISPALAKLKSGKINEDISLPRSLMPDALEFTRRTCKKRGLLNANYGHAGDGNIHVNIMFDRNDQNERSAAESAASEILKKVVEMGGTISGEHGIGILKKKFLKLEISTEELEIRRKIKAAFDPLGILNPGKVFDL